MKINGGTNYLYSSQRAQSHGVGSSDAASLSTGLSMAASSDAVGGVKQADFSNMTRQEMHDWMNDKIRGGEMSLDDSGAFMAMTMKMPASGSYSSELATAGDSARIDFMQKVRDGIYGALARNDATTLKMLQSAMSIMQQHQGQTIGVDTRV